jgi:hypothetical protein
MNGSNLRQRATLHAGAAAPDGFREVAAVQGTSMLCANLIDIPALLLAFALTRAMAW